MANREDKKRIAKNTFLLYVRMIFLMLIGLYTSRVILNALGVQDFGIYNVVGGLVAMFSILSGSLSSAISRFITFELGRGDKERLKNVFSTAVTIQIGLAGLIVILLETIGIWFLNHKMVIPIERVNAAHWVFHLSVVTCFVTLISIPYNAVIIAHEKMSAFAYISIIEASFKLMVAFIVLYTPIDRLISYSILMAVVALSLRFIYNVYSKEHFEECTYHFVFDKPLLKQMFGFAGWNLIGASSAVLRDQGGNVIINLFCGPAVNAARGIAMQVSDAVSRFVNGFMMALNPQITKSYAAGDKSYMMTLIYQGARFSFYMLLLLSLPIILNTHYILLLWLRTVPEHSVLFVQLILVFAMSESISNPLITAMLATGKIRNYQIIVGGLQMMNLPVSYILLRFGFIPESVLIVAIVVSQCCLAARLYMLRNMIGLSVRAYLTKVYLNVLSVCVLSVILPLMLAFKLRNDTFLNFSLITVCSIGCTVLTIFYVGFSSAERLLVRGKILELKSKFIK